ncbi:MAG: hypothetical protein AAGA44_17720, partial [Pseudomonadota bacterium]
RIYLVPGAVMQSVMIGGAYGTGREMIEYFTRFGMGGGILGLGVTLLAMAVIFALSLDVARRFQVYDYRRFSRVLLGRAWFLFEVCAVLLILLVLAVITAAAGSILADEFNLPSRAGGAVIFVAVGALIFSGRAWITTVLSFWSLFLYAVFAAYLIAAFVSLEPTREALEFRVEPGWLVSGLNYAFYNVAAIPLVLYASVAIETRRQAVTAGVIGAVIGVVPALMLHLSFAVDYPGIIDADLPVYHLLGQLDIHWLTVAYLVIIFGTFVETAAGNIQGVIERIEGTILERRGFGLGRAKHGLIAFAIMATAVSLSTAGIVDLVARGYSTIAWGFLLFYALPLVTIGVYKLYFPSVGEQRRASDGR